MDPDANLARQLEISKEIRLIGKRISRRFEKAHNDDSYWSKADEYNTDDRESIHELATELTGLVVALHEWMSRGGFAPKARQR
jgi:hypothetical protein